MITKNMLACISLSFVLLFIVAAFSSSILIVISAKEVMFLSWIVCLSVCLSVSVYELGYSESCECIFAEIFGSGFLGQEPVDYIVELI